MSVVQLSGLAPLPHPRPAGRAAEPAVSPFASLLDGEIAAPPPAADSPAAAPARAASEGGAEAAELPDAEQDEAESEEGATKPADPAVALAAAAQSLLIDARESEVNAPGGNDRGAIALPASTPAVTVPAPAAPVATPLPSPAVALPTAASAPSPAPDAISTSPPATVLPPATVFPPATVPEDPGMPEMTALPSSRSGANPGAKVSDAREMAALPLLNNSNPAAAAAPDALAVADAAPAPAAAATPVTARPVVGRAEVRGKAPNAASGAIASPAATGAQASLRDAPEAPPADAVEQGQSASLPDGVRTANEPATRRFAPADAADAPESLAARGEPPLPGRAAPADPAPPNPALPAGPATTLTAAPPAAHAPAPIAEASSAAVPLAGVAIEIVRYAREGRNRFELRLDPPELGRIDVRLDIDRDGHVTSRLIVERVDTLDLLRRDAPELERALRDAGLKTADNSLQFALRDQGSGAHGEGRTDRAGATRLLIADESIAGAQLPHRSPARAGGIDIRV